MKKIFPYLCAAFFLLFIWHLAASLFNRPLIVPPSVVFERLAAIWPELSRHAAFSLWRVATGTLCAVLVGYPVGLVLGLYSRFDKFLSPFVYLLYPVPKIALLPLIMLLLGLGEISKLLTLWLIIVFQIIIAVRDAVKNIEPVYYLTLAALGAKQRDVICRLIIPLSLPAFFTALRVSLATAISVLFFTETYGTEDGLGFFIMDAWQRINYPDLYAGVVILSALGLLVFVTLDALDGYFNNWK